MLLEMEKVTDIFKRKTKLKRCQRKIKISSK